MVSGAAVCTADALHAAGTCMRRYMWQVLHLSGRRCILYFALDLVS